MYLHCPETDCICLTFSIQYVLELLSYVEQVLLALELVQLLSLLCIEISAQDSYVLYFSILQRS